MIQWQRIWGERGAGAPPLFEVGGMSPPFPLWIAMNIYSMKFFNNLIKNTLLAPMSCGLVKS